MKQHSYKLTTSLLVLILFIYGTANITSAQEADIEATTPPTQSALTDPAGPSDGAQNNHRIYNDHLVPHLPPQSRAADIMNAGSRQAEAGQGIQQAPAGVGQGENLYSIGTACTDFNIQSLWSSHNNTAGNLWNDSYAGWRAFAYDNGDLFRAHHVAIARERTVGPGSKSGGGQYSLKIAGHQPYAAGLRGPVLDVAPTSVIEVSVKYMIFDHDTRGQDYDWVSLGIKPDAHGKEASYRNGYVRGMWTELHHSVISGHSGQIMIMIQAHSPAALNSNIYFDDIQIAVDGVFMTNCTY